MTARQSGGPGDEARSPELQRDLDISHDQWLSFLDGFSRQHLNWLATIEVVSSEGRLLVVAERRLQGISIDRSGPERIYVQVGETLNERMTHTVDSPCHIRFKQSLSGEHKGLEIASTDGTTTVIRFRSMMRPEMLNGIAS